MNAVDLNTEVKYVSKYDKAETKTVWLLGNIDTRIEKRLDDMSWEFEPTTGASGSTKAKVASNLGKTELEVMAFGLKGFENFMKPDGKPMYFKTEDRVIGGITYHVVAEEILKVIPGAVITELAKKIRELNSVSEDEVKN